MTIRNKRHGELAGTGDVITVPRIPNFIAAYREGTKDLYDYMGGTERVATWEPMEKMFWEGPSLVAPENDELFYIRQQRKNQVAKILDPAMTEVPDRAVPPNDPENIGFKSLGYSHTTHVWTEYLDGNPRATYVYDPGLGPINAGTAHHGAHITLVKVTTEFQEVEFWFIDYVIGQCWLIARLPHSSYSQLRVTNYVMDNSRGWDGGDDTGLPSPNNKVYVAFSVTAQRPANAQMGPYVAVIYLGYQRGSIFGATGGLWVETAPTGQQTTCAWTGFARTARGGLALITKRTGFGGYFVWSHGRDGWSEDRYVPSKTGNLPRYHSNDAEYHEIYNGLSVYLIKDRAGYKYFTYRVSTQEITWAYIDVNYYGHFLLVDPTLHSDGFIGYYEEMTKRKNDDGDLKRHFYRLYSREVPELLGGGNQILNYIVQSEPGSGVDDAQSALVTSDDGEGETVNYTIWLEKAHNTDIYVFDTESDKGDCWPAGPFHKVTVQPDSIIFYFKEYGAHELKAGQLIAMPEFGIEGDWAPTVTGGVGFPTEQPYIFLEEGGRLVNATMGAAV